MARETSPFDAILKSRKYRGLDLPEQTLSDLYEREMRRYSNQKDAIQAVREKLHNIIAPYLGDPDYEAAEDKLRQAFSAGDLAQQRDVCCQLMRQHASTRERIPLLDEFYERLFAVTGRPRTVLDLACGLNPLAFLWMGLPLDTRYHAYDLHHPRINLLNTYFELQGLPRLAEHRDILVSPPDVMADAAFFFKEAHRFEQRQHGCNRAFWQALNVRWLLVSLPITNLTGQRDLLERQRNLVARTLEGLDWPVTEVLLDTELIFCIEKNYGA
jgi:16S rRNA (guanine(1405)-N(7))-methyltransferase